MKKKVTEEMFEEMKQELEAKEAELLRIGRLRGECRPIVEEEDGTAELSAIEQQERRLRHEIKSLKNVLDNCEIIEDEQLSDTVGVNSIVTVEFLEEGEEPYKEKVTLLKANQMKGVVLATPESPLGSFILGKPVGFFGEYLVRTGDRFAREEYRIGCKILAIE